MNIILTKYSWLRSTFFLSIIVLILLMVACSSTSSEEQISVADDQNVSESNISEVPTSVPTQVPTPEPTQLPTPIPAQEPTAAPAESSDQASSVEIDSCAEIPDLDQRSMCEFGLSMGLTIEEMISMAESMGMDPQEMVKMAESMGIDDMMEMAESMDMDDMMDMAESMDMDDMMEMAESMDMDDMMEMAESMDMDMDDMMDMADSMDMDDMMDMADSMDMDDMMDMADSMDMTESMDMDEMMDMAESMLGEVDDCDAEKNMMKRMMCKMASSMGSGSNSGHSDEAPKLMNLLMQNLGPWDQVKETFGDLKFDSRFGTTIFDDFGMLHNPGQSNEYDNPTFEFKAPADSIVISPVSGVVTRLVWQPSSGYKQDDWEIIISPSKSSNWGVLIDHLVSIDCDRTGTTPVNCELPLTINGEVISEGTTIEANDVIGYVGNWEDTTNSGINGRTELTLFKYYSDKSGVTNYCPTMYLDESVESLFKTKIQELMSNYDTWPGNNASSNQDQKVFSYNQGEMVSPGCKYSAIEEDSTTGVTTPVVD